MFIALVNGVEDLVLSYFSKKLNLCELVIIIDHCYVRQI